MQLGFSLQWRVLLFVTGGMAVTLLLSIYLHGLIARRLMEDVRYDAAVAETVAIAERVAALELFADPTELQRDVELVAKSQPDFLQIDVYRDAAGGRRLVASNRPAGRRLPVLDEHTPDNDLQEMERPVRGAVTMEVAEGGVRCWLISMAISQREGTGHVTARVVKRSSSPALSAMQTQHDLVLSGAILLFGAIVGLLFHHFFRRPARDIVEAMTVARRGNLSARAGVRRDDELGEIARGFNAMMEDISARARERETLLATISGFNDDLRHEIGRTTVELEATNAALLQSQQRLGRAERLAAMGQVAASLAHEIGTPLNAIAGHLQLLGRRLSGDADAQRRVAIITQQLDSIVLSVRGLLRRTRAPRAAVRPTDLGAVIAHLLRLVGPTLQAHRIELEVTLQPDLPPVMADPDSLNQVLLNLINNSIDAMPPGGRLTLEARCTADGAAQVRVQDSGPGVAPEILDHLFDPTWTTKDTGSGFGLAIAREIMTEHGGGIELEPHAGGGAVFRLWMPLANAAASA